MVQADLETDHYFGGIFDVTVGTRWIGFFQKFIHLKPISYFSTTLSNRIQRNSESDMNQFCLKMH